MLLAQAKIIGTIPVSELARDQPQVAPDAPLMEALHVIVDHGVSHLPVVDHGHLLGIVTERELLGEVATVLGPLAMCAAPDE
jgi:CBS domain-containing protein